MKAVHHTQLMLHWWARHGISQVDLVVRRQSGSMLWHHQLELSQLPLPWIRAENAHRSEIYIRPARHRSWPILFLDDVHPSTAARVARAYRALIIRTSRQGGCHIWLACSSRLDESQRHACQRWIAPKIHADPASTSGEHLGRLAGFKNWKRDGQWVNVISSRLQQPRWNPPLHALHFPSQTRPQQPQQPLEPHTSCDSSPSGRDWAWVCKALETGISPSRVAQKLRLSAQQRKGLFLEDYIQRTISKALQHTRNRSISTPTGGACGS